MEEHGRLHIVMLPSLAFGHMIPYLELSQCLAQMGHRVSFLSTPRNIDRLPAIPHELRPRLTLVKLTPPRVDGLPEDAQSTVDVPPDRFHLINRLQDGLEGPLCAFMEEDHGHAPDWIIYDIFLYWVPQVARKYCTPSVFYLPCTALSLVIMGPPSVLLEGRDERVTPEQLTVPPPWVTFPTTMAFRYHEAVQIVNGTSRTSLGSGLPQTYVLGMTFQGCDVVAVRSTIEIEPEWINLLGQLFKKPVFPIGLLSPSVPPQTNAGGDERWVDQEWLDAQKQDGSTVYVGFGSELRFNREQVHELAFGLELSELPFFWAYRGDPGLLPDGFEDRNKDSGLVYMGWARQAQLLAHPSVGCFLMHGGWGSSIEGLRHGKPLIMLPFIADQGMNTRFMEEKKVGVEVPRNQQDGSFTRDAVAKCLKLVMLEEEGATIRSNAREMVKIFGNKERHTQDIEEFVNYLMENRRRDCKPTLP